MDQPLSAAPQEASSSSAETLVVPAEGASQSSLLGHFADRARDFHAVYLCFLQSHVLPVLCLTDIQLRRLVSPHPTPALSLSPYATPPHLTFETCRLRRHHSFVKPSATHLPTTRAFRCRPMSSTRWTSSASTLHTFPFCTIHSNSSARPRATDKRSDPCLLLLFSSVLSVIAVCIAQQRPRFTHALIDTQQRGVEIGLAEFKEHLNNLVSLLRANKRPLDDHTLVIFSWWLLQFVELIALVRSPSDPLYLSRFQTAKKITDRSQLS